MFCRHCNAALTHEFVDLGFSPPSNAYLYAEQLGQPEVRYPLKVLVCSACWLVQTQDFTQADQLFTPDYAYFSSISSSWLAHAAQYCQEISQELGLDEDSFVIEVAANDGYLLRNFLKSGVPCLGIEPTARVADAARSLGLNIIEEFLTEELAGQVVSDQGLADLVIGNNVYAHVPAINDFTRGLKVLLAPDGVVTLEFPYLPSLMEKNAFDTVYHEHFSYLSLSVVSQIFNSCGLSIYRARKLPTHGGSLRIYGCHDGVERIAEPSVGELLEQERSMGLNELSSYSGFGDRCVQVKHHVIVICW